MNGKKRRMRENHGFTLLELLAAMAIFGVVMAGIYSTYHSQQRSYLVQEQVAEAQQNLRAGMYLMEREIRMAGYDPSGGAGAGIQAANSNSITFTSDIHDAADYDGADDDGDGLIDEDDEVGYGNADGSTSSAGENITYSLLDLDSDGDLDLCRTDNVTGEKQPVAMNIDALDLVYLDENGAVTTDPSLARGVQITMVAHTDRKDPNHTDTETYKNQQDDSIFTPPSNDHFRRKLLTAEVVCRNLGL